MMQSVQFGAVYKTESKSKAKGKALTEIGKGEKVVLRPHWNLDVARTLSEGKGQPQFTRQWLVATAKDADVMARAEYNEGEPPIQNLNQLLEKLGLSAKIKLENILKSAQKPGQGLGQLLSSILSQGGAGLKDMASAVKILGDIQGAVKKLGDPAELPVDTDLDVYLLLTSMAVQAKSLDAPPKLP